MASLSRFTTTTLARRKLAMPVGLRNANVAMAAAKTTLNGKQFRSFHTDPMTGEKTGYADLDYGAVTIEKIQSPNSPPPSSTLVFGHSFSDHMVTANWNSLTGWAAPAIHPYKPLVLDPSSVIFHYAPSLFEGMKAYKDVNGRIRLFRPDMNMARLNRSATRIALPEVNGKELTKLIAKLVSLDADFVPSEPGHSIYIRPTLIGTQAALGVHPANEAMLFVILSPVGPYFKSGFKPVALEADPNKVRAWPNGTGSYKLGLNYAPGLQPQMEAATRGYSQNLWLFGPEHNLTEVGTMNLFTAIKNDKGQTELITAPLNGLILPGVTRDSILGLARDHASGKMRIEGLPEDLIVSERELSMKEVEQAGKEGRLMEMFGSGTAVVVAPVDRIGYEGRDIHIPVGEEGVGPIAKRMLDTINDIQLGRIEHPWSVVVDDLI